MSAVTATLVRVHALAWNGMRQAVRDKVLYVLAGACVVFILGSVIVSSLTIGERSRIVMDMGLSVTSILTTLMAVVVGINQAAREVERRTVDVILSKPVARWEFLAGRLCGLAATLGLMVIVLGALHLVVLLSIGAADPDAFKALLLIWVEAVLVAALALFFSTFTTPLPSLFITLGVVLVGHTSWGLEMMAQRLGASPLAVLLHGLRVVLPNLELLDVKAQVVWDAPIPPSLVLGGVAYGLAYSTALVALASAILSRRDLR